MTAWKKINSRNFVGSQEQTIKHGLREERYENESWKATVSSG